MPTGVPCHEGLGPGDGACPKLKNKGTEVTKTDLPPLPEPDVYLIVADNGKYAEAGGDYGDPYFDADQVRAYAAEVGAENGRLRAALTAIDRHSVITLRTNSKDRGDWAEDVAFMGKLARGA